MLEAIDLCQGIAGRELSWSYEEQNRIGDHIWWIGDNTKFESHYPDWAIEYDVGRILKEIYAFNERRWHP